MEFLECGSTLFDYLAGQKWRKSPILVSGMSNTAFLHNILIFCVSTSLVVN